jgi:glycogen synthase
MPNILHASLEYKKGVGGIKAVLTGLLPAQASNGVFNVAIITPFYDVYNEFYLSKSIELLGIIKHIYKGRIFCSEVVKVITDNDTHNPIMHFMIRPTHNSPVAWIFNIGDEKKLYQAFPHSEPGNRVEYFVSAVAALLRLGLHDFPNYDIFHAHAWHTGLAGCLMKEFENLSLYRDLNPNNQPLRKIPHFISTVHMLTSAEHGQLTTIESVKGFLASVGLPADIIHRFPEHRNSIQENYLKRVVFALLYSDMVTMVSKGLVTEVVNGQAAGLEKIFADLARQNRLYGITNGITVGNWDARQEHNLPGFNFKNELSIIESKKRIKDFLVTKYSKLQADKIWFVFVGRFAAEKGVDMLLPAVEAINQIGANLIIMGTHVAYVTKNNVKVPAYQDLFDEINQKDNVVVIDEAEEQKKVGKLFRAAAQYMLIVSHNEACGLVSMEGFANAALAVGPKIQGVPDSVRGLVEDPQNGTGFLYSDEPEYRIENLKSAINLAVEYYNKKSATNTIEPELRRILEHVNQFDWNATPLREYIELYARVLQQPLLTYDQVRVTTAPSMLHQFSGQTRSVFSGKIFQLGFNKCGSQTIHNYLWLNGVKCLHYGNVSGSIARRIMANFTRGEPLIGPEYDQYYGFFDMEDPYAQPPIYIAPEMFRLLDQQYKDSKFILNTRPKENWIRSRLSHVDQTNGKRYVDALLDFYRRQNPNFTEVDLIELWSKQWDEHHAAVLDYFKDRPQDLLIINIDEGTDLEKGQKIADFFAGRYMLDPNKFGHLNRTPQLQTTHEVGRLKPVALP